jgi:hyperosmotically inducible protein
MVASVGLTEGRVFVLQSDEVENSAMKTPQLMCAALVAMLPLAACNRSDTRDKAQVAAAEVKNAAGRAGEKLADGWLATKIQAQYFADDDVKARTILVSARDGVVRLRGTVDSQNAHDQALQIARNTDGVKTVEDELTGPAASSPAPVPTSGIAPATLPALAERLNDAGVTASIQAKYFLDGTIKGRRIDVDTRQGVVTLRGEVASDDERAQALLLARTTEGVQRVEDALAVNAALSPAAASAADPGNAPVAAAPSVAPEQTQDSSLASDIQSQLGADQQLKGAAIEVTAKDGVVLLEGTVPSAAMKQKALSTARSSKGVLQVVDRLSIKRR